MSEPIARRDALVGGATDAELRSLYTRNGWSRLQPGYHLPPEVDAVLDDAARHRALVAAMLPALSPEAVVSHQSALVLHGIPVWGAPLDRVHVTRNRSAGGYKTRQLHLHSGPVDNVLTVDGMPTMSVARAVVDFARISTFEQAVVSGDAALRRSGCSTADLADAVAYAQGRPGYRAALRALAFFDCRSESVGESRSRVVLATLKLPAPELQTSFFDADGHLIGRSDFFFEEHGVIGEFDGKVKYDRFVRADETPSDVVYREKRREDDLHDMGWEVVRWIWADLSRPDVLRARFERAFARRRNGSRPTGGFLRAV